MAAPFTKLQQAKLPTGPSPITPEQQYWKAFRSQQILPSPGGSFAVTHISFPPPPSNPLLAPSNDYFAVTTGMRVQLFSIKTRKVVKTINRFSAIAHSGEMRRDGRILVAGDEDGIIQAFQVDNRAILKTWKEHKQAVWVTKSSPTDLTTLMSASDDQTVRLWDLTGQESTTKFLGHTDYVRSASFMPGNMSNMVISGSYDETVRLWDPRVANRAAMIFKHAAPVESVIPMPSGTTVLAAAESQISILDLVAGKPLQLLKNHQRTVTSLSLASNGTRLVSGGMDGHLKIFETGGWNVVAGSKYPSPILSVNVIPAGPQKEDRHLVVGMASGLLSIRTKLSGEQKVKERERAQEMQALLDGTLEEHDKKQSKKRKIANKDKLSFVGEGADVVIEGDSKHRKLKEARWEAELRKGRYSKALDVVLDGNVAPITVLTALTALRHRSAMRAAFQDRDENTVQPILKWVCKHIKDPRYVTTCVESSLLLLDLYSEHIGASPELEKYFKLLARHVRNEVEKAQQALQTCGMLGMLMCKD